MNFDNFTIEQLEALHRVCKTRAYAFFRDPKEVIRLREAIRDRYKANA